MEQTYLDELDIKTDKTFTEKLRLGILNVDADASFWKLVDSDFVTVNGSASFFDNVTCDNLHASGVTLFKKNLVCQNAKFDGRAECYGMINTDKLFVDGQLDVCGRIASISIDVSGKLTTSNIVSADYYNVSGSIVCKSKLRAIDFKSRFNGDSCRLVKLEAEVVDVKSDMVVPNDYSIVCDTMVCSVAKLEYAKIDDLFCDIAYIGKGCVIRRLECSGEPVIERGAIVEEVIRF